MFLEWHFLNWKLHNAKSDSLDFAKALYDRVYLHDHTSSVREVEFIAWGASANREGFKLVPVEPTLKMSVAYEKNSIAPVSSLSVAGYKAMIGGC